MQLLVFVSDNGSDTGTAPTLFVPATPDAVLPRHPSGMSWRYFATIGEDDELLDIGGKEGIELDGYYISRRLV